MENTLENKAKFFAQYWGVEAVRYDEYTKPMAVDFVDFIEMKESIFLELKPLSSITDEDAILLIKIIYPEFEMKEILYKMDRFINFITQIPIYHISMECLGENSAHAFDFIRSKGYALPWMGLSVEKLVEYGWGKLKGNKS